MFDTSYSIIIDFTHDSQLLSNMPAIFQTASVPFIFHNRKTIVAWKQSVTHFSSTKNTSYHLCHVFPQTSFNLVFLFDCSWFKFVGRAVFLETNWDIFVEMFWDSFFMCLNYLFSVNPPLYRCISTNYSLAFRPLCDCWQLSVVYYDVKTTLE